MIAVLFLCLLTQLPVSAEKDPDLLFYCSYDGKANADFSRGNGSAKCKIAPEFQSGIKGKALVIGGKLSSAQRIVNGVPKNKQEGRNCYYSPKNNFDLEKGSISFWVKPLDWNGGSKGFNVLFRTGAPKIFFQIYKFLSGERLNFICGELRKWTKADLQMRDWKAGQWYHLAATWSLSELRLYLNGKIMSVSRIRFPLKKNVLLEPLSVGPGGSWRKAYIGKTLIDELRIYNRPLTHEEVMGLYLRNSAGLPVNTGLITIGIKTPRLDGKINDFEYSFTGTGFSGLDGFLSMMQSNFFLSYDQDNLYFGFKSKLKSDNGISAGKYAANDNRIELLIQTDAKAKTIRRFIFTPDGKVFQEKDCSGKPVPANLPVKSGLTHGNWTLEAAVPFKLLGVKSAPTTKGWRINTARIFPGPNGVTSAAQVVGKLTDLSNFINLHFRPDAPQLRIAGLYDMINYCNASDISVKPKRPNSEIEAVMISNTTRSYGLQTRTYRVFSKGKSRPLVAPKLPQKVWKLHDFALNEVKIVEKRNGKRVPLYQEKFTYESQAPLKVLFLYTQDRKKLFIAARRRAGGKIRTSFLRPDKSVAFQMEQDIPSASNYFNAVFDLDYSKLPPAEYTVKVDHVASDGKVTEVHRQEYQIPSIDTPILEKYVDQDAGIVPKPWTPLVVHGDTIKIWGRKYDFSHGFLFSSLLSQKRELLTGPAYLSLNGRRLDYKSNPFPVLKSANQMLAVIDKNADLGKLKISSKIKTYFGGYSDISMSITPEKDSLKVKSLSLNIPLRSKYATLVRDNKISVLGGGKTGAVGKYWCQSLADGPFLWVGNEQVGFTWLAPNLQGWHFRRVNKNVEIIRKGNTAILRLNLIDHPVVLDKPMNIRFGFTLTPTRPLDKKILRCRVDKEWQKWCKPWKYHSFPDYDTADVGKIKWRGREYKEVFLYLGDSFMSPYHPCWGFWEEEWRRISPARNYGEWTGHGFSMNRKIRDAYTYTEACIRCDSFRNFLLHNRNKFFTKAKKPLTLKAKNYYFDIGIRASLCENSHHGCSLWKADNGRKYGTMPIDEYREIGLNTYRMIKRTGPDAKIIFHQGWFRCMPIQHFCDCIIGGEGVENLVAAKGNYYDILTPEMFRATFLPQTWGVKTAFLHMLIRAIALSPKKLAKFNDAPKAKHALHHIYGYTMVHDVDNWDPHSQTLKDRNILWAAQDKIGWDENVLFYPYWDENPAVKLVSPKSKRILASAYVNNGKLLLAVLNDTPQSQHIKLKLDMQRLGVKPGLSGYDAWQPKKAYTLSDSWEDTIPARGFVLIPFCARNTGTLSK